MQVVQTSFHGSFPGWQEHYESRFHPREPCIDWTDIPSLGNAQDKAEDSEGEEEDLQDADSHVPLDGAARHVLGDGQAPEMVKWRIQDTSFKLYASTCLRAYNYRIWLQQNQLVCCRDVLTWINKFCSMTALSLMRHICHGDSLFK